MTEKLEGLFTEVDRSLNRDHKKQREDLLAQLRDATIGASTPSATRGTSILKSTAAVLAVLVITGSVFLLASFGSENLWAANDKYSVDVSVSKRKDGSVVSHYKIQRENGTIAEPLLTVIEGQSASISVSNAAREVEIQQIFVDDAKQILVVVSIKNAEGMIEWAAAFTVDVETENSE